MSKRDLYIKARASTPPSFWTRPTDWLPMPTVVSTDDTFVGLHAVFPSGQNFCAFSFTTNGGDYQVDWGDGTITTHTSNTTAEHEYDYTTYDPSNSTLSSRGYKQAMVIVTPLTGNLTTCNFQLRYTTVPAQNQAYATGFLDCILSMPNADTGLSINFGGNNVRHTYVERFEMLNIGGCTNMANMFVSCNSLQSVPLFDTSNVTSMILMFQGCFSLQTVPLFDTSSVVNMASMFNTCRSLQSVPLFDTSSVANMGAMFNNCNSLQSVPLFDTSSVTVMGNMFQGCFSLQTVPPFDTSNVTAMGTMFQGCSSLNRTDIVCRVDVGFQNNQMSRAELVNVFNNLIDRSATTAATIIITGNWGASALTTAERDIALNKNWIIIG